mgnify:CR=1 FL=1
MFRRRYKKCFCMNNNSFNTNANNNLIEDKCDNVRPYDCEEIETDMCSCGFDEEYEMSVFPENPMLAQSYVPLQFMDKTFKPEVGLKMGTIFPELVSPYMPCQSMRVNEFLESTNKVGEGCNK